jgi:DNA-binding XRE family transcriptional regulator
MLAVVKKPHTDAMLFEIKGDIPNHVLCYLQQEFGSDVKIVEEDELVNIFETDWYKGVSATIIPGDAVRVYRENFGLSPMILGQKLGGMTEEFVVEMECGKREISWELAEKLGQLFEVPIERFLFK